MTIDQWLNIPDVAIMEKMTDEDLLLIFKDSLVITRAEKRETPNPNKPKPRAKKAVVVESKEQKLLMPLDLIEMARLQGVKL